METTSDSTSYLSFLINEEYFAVKIQNVLEVLEMQKIIPIPKTPKYIRGVINFRGEILPVIDTRLKFNMIENQNKSNNVIIVLEINQDDNENKLLVGTIADSVKNVVDVKPLDIMLVPDFNTIINSEYTDGIFKNENNFITILNIDKIFSLNNKNQKHSQNQLS
ncbi:MAG: chemotaxis protein CheW [Bacteroidales bacterium]|nr:chemotaxis protein CheW [Bacteroidales bacterium]